MPCKQGTDSEEGSSKEESIGMCTVLCIMSSYDDSIPTLLTSIHHRIISSPT